MVKSFDVAGSATNTQPLSQRYLRPHKSFKAKLLKAFSPSQAALVATSIVISSLFAVTVLSDVQFKDGQGTEIPTWKPVFVFNLFIFFVALVMGGANPEASLVGLAAIAVLFNCSNAKKLFAGAASGSVTSLCLLFPIVKAFNETGYPATLVGKLLGQPKNPVVGLIRMVCSVAVFSSLIMNTMVTATMIPVLVTWTQRLNLDVRMFMMPLTFAVQTGGSLTLLGSSTNFVGQEVFLKSTAKTANPYNLGFFDLTLPSFILFVVAAVYCVVLAPKFLKKSEDDEDSDGDAEAAIEAEEPRGVQSLVEINRNIYNIKMIVVPEGQLVGQRLEDSGVRRMKGVKVLHPVRPEALHGPLIALDEIHIDATAEGVAALRHVRGLELINDHSELAMLGAGRRQRRLMEAVAGPALAGQSINVTDFRLTNECAVVSVRTPMMEQEYLDSYDGHVIQDGDVLLIEGFPAHIGSEDWLRTFGVIRIVANSQPQRAGTFADKLRATSLGIGLAIVIIGASLSTSLDMPNIQLNVLCVLLLCFMIITKATTVKEAYSAVNSGVLLSIVGAIALGDAVESTGLANYLAEVVVAVCVPYGKYAVLLGLYVAAAGLGLVITNPAVVAILGEIGTRTGMNPQCNIPVETIAIVLVLASSNCYMSPYAYASNLMVMPVGKYTWGDYIKFGGPLQFIHMIVTIIVAPWCMEFNKAFLAPA